MPHFRHEFWLFFTQSSQKQAPHDLQTYIFSGENDLLHDVHFIIFTAFSLYYLPQLYPKKRNIYLVRKSRKLSTKPHPKIYTEKERKFTKQNDKNNKKKAQKSRKNSLKPAQNNGSCSTWNKCGQLIVSRETYKINIYQNGQNIPLFHVKRRFRKMWISFNRFASKLTYCQPIDIIVLRK